MQQSDLVTCVHIFFSDSFPHICYYRVIILELLLYSYYSYYYVIIILLLLYYRVIIEWSALCYTVELFHRILQATNYCLNI